MRYAQIEGGNRLHLVFEGGEGLDSQHLIPAGSLSAPLCNTNWFKGKYRMTINLPLRNACKNCTKAFEALSSDKGIGGDK